MSPPRWNHTTTCKFVELYVQHECLWNMNIMLYRNKQARERALLRIVEDMAVEGFGVEEVKQKIKSLRATYQQEEAKIIKSARSGAGVDDVYTPTMKWFNAMRNVMKQGQLKRATCSNMDSRSNNNNTETETTDNSSEYTQECEEDIQESINPLQTETQKRQQKPAENLSTKCNLPSKNKRARSKLSEVKSAVEELKQLNQSIMSVDAEDACDIFGRHIAMQLKQLSAEQCIIAQDQIQRVLTRFRLDDLRSQSSRASINSHQSYTHEYLSTPMESPLSNDSVHGQQHFTYQKSPNNTAGSLLPLQAERPDVLAAAIATIHTSYVDYC